MWQVHEAERWQRLALTLILLQRITHASQAGVGISVMAGDESTLDLRTHAAHREDDQPGH